jgi:Lamin Tail Domain
MEHPSRKNFLRNSVVIIIFLLGAGGIWFFMFGGGPSWLFGPSVTQISSENMESSTYSAATPTSSPDDDTDDAMDGTAIPIPPPTKSPAIKNSVKKSAKDTPAVSRAPVAAGTLPVTEVPIADQGPASGTIATVGTAPAASACAFPKAPASSHEIIVNEIAWMGSPSSSDVTAADASKEEWIELKNISGEDVDLSGWQLSNASGKINIVFDADDTISAGGFFLLARNTSTSLPGDFPSQKIYSGDLVNTGDVLALQDAQCDVSDFVDASAGWPAGNNTTKQTLERNADGVGWHTSAGGGGGERAGRKKVFFSFHERRAGRNARRGEQRFFFADTAILVGRDISFFGIDLIFLGDRHRDVEHYRGYNNGRIGYHYHHRNLYDRHNSVINGNIYHKRSLDYTSYRAKPLNRRSPARRILLDQRFYKDI